MLGIELLGLRVGVGHADRLGERGAIRRIVDAVVRDAVPVPVEQRLPGEVSTEGEERVVVLVLDAEVPRLDRPASGDEDRRVRLLDRLRPAVHVPELVVLPVERERLGLPPRLHDQVVVLRILVPRQRRDLAVAVVRVHRRPDREPGDQPPAGDHVEHGEFLRHPDRRVVQRDRVADHADRRLRRPAGEPGGDDVRRRHEAVAVLVVLVDADAVVPQRVGELQLVHVLVVHAMTFDRVVQRLVDVDPHRTVLLAEVVRHVRPRHQVEPHELHRNPSPDCRPSDRSRRSYQTCEPIVTWAHVSGTRLVPYRGLPAVVAGSTSIRRPDATS